MWSQLPSRKRLTALSRASSRSARSSGDRSLNLASNRNSAICLLLLANDFSDFWSDIAPQPHIGPTQKTVQPQPSAHGADRNY